jgi:hypothetical protein
MTAAWPVTVTQFVTSSNYSERAERNVSEFQPDVGPPMTRRRSSVSSDLVTFETATVPDSQYDDLLYFYRFVLKDGSLTFFRKHPRNNDGTNVEFKFVEAPQWRALSNGGSDGLGRISVSLRRMP